MLNLLVLDHDFSTSYFKNPIYFWNELEKITDSLFLYTPLGDGNAINLDDIVDMCPFKPDFIIINEFFCFHWDWKINRLKKYKIPIAYMPHDVDDSIEIRRKFLEEHEISLIFPLYKYSFLKHYPELIHKVHWLPHHVNTEVFKDYNLPKTIDGILIGRVKQHYYQLRQKILQKMNGHPGFFYDIHPSDQVPINYNYNWIQGEAYSKLINQSKIFFTCCSARKYPLLKYFEVLASRTLLLADTCPELTELGFISGTHFVEIDEYNFYEKFLYYVNNHSERNQIATSGYQFIRKFHTTSIRAQQLVSYLNNFLKKCS